MSFEWNVYVKTNNNVRIGEVDDYTSLELSKKFNDVGAWVLDIDQNSPQISNLLTDGNGILVTRNDEYFFSGPVTKHRFSGNATKGMYTITGADENIWLDRRVVAPNPSQTNPVFYSTEFDVRTGVASTIMRQFVDWNLDNSAIVPRRKAGFEMTADPVVGSTVTGRGRWQKLLELLQELAIAGGDLGFQCIQIGNVVSFDVYAPVDRSASARFSYDNENIASVEYEISQTEGNYLYVGGSGDGASRVIYERPDSESMAALGRIEGEFIDGRDTNLSAELDQAAVDWLAQNGRTVSLSLEAIDTPNLSYGVDYDLGDIVLVQVNGETIQDVVREVAVKLDKDSAIVSPTIGTGKLDRLRVLKTIAAMKARIADLERRK